MSTASRLAAYAPRSGRRLHGLPDRRRGGRPDRHRRPRLRTGRARRRPARPPGDPPMSPVTGTAGTATRPGNDVELAIHGMTCASCANRIEKKLNKLDGVTATVNYATEKAKVRFAEGVPPEALLAAVASAGYSAALPSAEPAGPTAPEPDDPAAALKQRLLVVTVLTVPVIALSMVPALQFRAWQWLSLTLAAPVVLWGALPFHRAAWENLRHGAATMDTLISRRHAGGVRLVGVRAVPRHGRRARHGPPVRADHPSQQRRGRHLPRGRRRGDDVHPGRPLPRGALQARAPARRCAPCSSSAPRTSPCCATASRPGSRSSSWPSVTPSWCGPARRSRPTASVVEGTSALDASLLTGESVPVEVGPGDPVVGPTVNAGGRLVVTRHPGRRGHPAGADRPAGRGRAERQGAGPAARRPHLRGVRAGRDRARRGRLRASGSAPAAVAAPRSRLPSPC